jgi:hypothetical protein
MGEPCANELVEAMNYSVACLWRVIHTVGVERFKQGAEQATSKRW